MNAFVDDGTAALVQHTTAAIPTSTGVVNITSASGKAVEDRALPDSQVSDHLVGVCIMVVIRMR